jgi:hypothetical protein
MEQAQHPTERIRRGAVGCNGLGIGCIKCGYYIGISGHCNCNEAFTLSDLDQRQRDDYRTQFLDLIRCIIQTGVPNLYLNDHNSYELQRFSRIGFQYDGIIYSITYNVKGVNVHLA